MPSMRSSRAASKLPHALLDKYGMTPAQLMLNWVMYKDAVVAIPKASNLEHVEQNAAAIRSRISADDYKAGISEVRVISSCRARSPFAASVCGASSRGRRGKASAWQ